MSKKPLTYDFYPTMFQTTQEHMRSLIGREALKIPRRELIQDISRTEPHFFKSLNLLIMADELAYERSNREVLIPESEAIYRELLGAKYSMSSAKGFSMPFSSFVLCMPEGFEIQGVEIPSCLVSYGNYSESPERIVYPFTDYLGVPRPEVNLERATPGANALTITYKEPGTIAYARVMAVDDDLPAILNAETPEQCREEIGDYGFFERLVDMNEKDLIIQFYLMKLVSSIGIYLLANTQKSIATGFPGKGVPKLIGRDPKMNIRMSTLLNRPPKDEPLNPKKPNRWHFSVDDRQSYTESSMKDVKLNWLWN